MKKKNVTIDQLATMVHKGFDEERIIWLLKLK